MRRRRTLRLHNYDYRQSGAYFVTICTYEAACLFGYVTDGEMILNDIGNIVRDEWLQTSHIRSNVQLDAFVVMPNHIHGIIHIVAIEDRATQRVAPTGKSGHAAQIDHAPRRSSSLQAGSLGAIVGQFKSAVSKRCWQRMGLSDLQIWQRGYYDSILQNERILNDARRYIGANPERWFEDKYYVQVR